MKGPLTLRCLRTILAILIALSLSLAPVASAWAAMQMHAGMEQDAATATDSEDAMSSDCMKAMQGKAHKGCDCCDTQSKAACPDTAACLAKCGSSVLAVLTPELITHREIVRHHHPKPPEKPPDRTIRPPAPPPKS